MPLCYTILLYYLISPAGEAVHLTIMRQGAEWRSGVPFCDSLKCSNCIDHFQFDMQTGLSFIRSVKPQCYTKNVNTETLTCCVIVPR